MRLVGALVGGGFTIGAAAHLIGFVLSRFGVELYAHYPSWRHPTLAILDAAIAWIAFRRAQWLHFALAGFLLEQFGTNGAPALLRWVRTGEIEWFVVFMHALIILGLLVAWHSLDRSARGNSPR